METHYWLLAFIVIMALFYVPYYFGYLTSFWLKITGIAFAVFGFAVAFALGDWTEGNPIQGVALLLLLIGVIFLLVG